MAKITIEIESDAPGLTAKVRDWTKRMVDEGGLDVGTGGELHPLWVLATVDNDGVVEPVYGAEFDPDGLDLDGEPANLCGQCGVREAASGHTACSSCA